jgi:hypothetical protein
MIYLLLLCYLDLTLIVVEHLSTNTSLSAKQKRQVLLRVHKDAIVADHFRLKLNEMKNGTKVVDDDCFHQYKASLRTRRLATQSRIGLFIDDVQALEGQFPDLLFDQMDSRFSSSFSSVFFRKLCGALGDLHYELKVPSFITETSFCVPSHLASYYDPFIAVIEPLNDCLKVMNETGIKEILFHYFDLEEIVKVNTNLQQIIRDAVGRPSICMNVLMKPLWNLLYAHFKKFQTRMDVLTGEDISTAWNSGCEETIDFFVKRFKAFFDSHPDLTTRNVFSAIAQSYFFTGGSVNILTDSMITDAIKFGLLPLSDRWQPRMIRPSREPLLFRAFERYLLGNFRTVDELLLPTISGLLQNSANRNRAELSILLQIAFTVLKSRDRETRATDAIDRKRPSTAATLREILLPFFESESDMPFGMEEWFVSCSYIKDISVTHATDEDPMTRKFHSFLRAFIQEDGSYDYSSILWNMDSCRDVDIAFLVHNRNCTSRRVVAMKVEKGIPLDIPTALLSLHPALQYLSANQRNYISDKVNHKKRNDGCLWSVCGPAGFMYSDFEDHRQLGTSTTHSSLMKDWIRVV